MIYTQSNYLSYSRECRRIVTVSKWPDSGHAYAHRPPENLPDSPTIGRQNLVSPSVTATTQTVSPLGERATDSDQQDTQSHVTVSTRPTTGGHPDHTTHEVDICIMWGCVVWVCRLSLLQCVSLESTLCERVSETSVLCLSGPDGGGPDALFTLRPSSPWRRRLLPPQSSCVLYRQDRASPTSASR